MGIYSAGIHFNSYFSIGKDVKLTAGGLNDPADTSCIQNRRRAAPDIESVEPQGIIAGELHLTGQSVKECRLKGGIGGGVKVAIRTLPDAKRDVDVNSRRWVSWRKA